MRTVIFILVLFTNVLFTHNMPFGINEYESVETDEGKSSKALSNDRSFLWDTGQLANAFSPKINDIRKSKCFLNMIYKLKKNAQEVVNEVEEIIRRLKPSNTTSKPSRVYYELTTQKSWKNVIAEDYPATTEVESQDFEDSLADGNVPKKHHNTDVDKIFEKYADHKSTYENHDPFCDVNEESAQVTAKKHEAQQISDNMQLKKLNKWQKQIESCKELLRLHSATTLAPRGFLSTVSRPPPATTLRTDKSFESTRSSKEKDHHEEKMWTKWSNWTPCSATCGMGRQLRYRKCAKGQCPADIEMDERECMQSKCDLRSF